MPSLLARNIHSQEILTNTYSSKLMKLNLRRSDEEIFQFSHKHTLIHNKTQYSNAWTLAQGQHTCRRADSNTFFLLPAPTQACHQECQLALIRRRCAGSRQLHCARLSQPPSSPCYRPISPAQFSSQGQAKEKPRRRQCEACCLDMRGNTTGFPGSGIFPA